MLVSFNKNYITVFTANFSCPLLTELQDLGHTARPKSGTSMSYENVLWMNGISWISASSTKSLESGEIDFKLVWLDWLQEEESLVVKREHFSLLTFCHVLFLKGRF